MSSLNKSRFVDQVTVTGTVARSIIPAALEVEIRRIKVQGQLGQKVSETPISTNKLGMVACHGQVCRRLWESNYSLGWSWAKNGRSYLKNNLKAKNKQTNKQTNGLGHGSSSGLLVYQVPQFKTSNSSTGENKTKQNKTTGQQGHR
jgi:hypothetical protein